MYAHTLTSHECEVLKQVIGQVRRFAQIWENEELDLSSEIREIDSKMDRKQKFLRQPRQATWVVSVLSVNRIFIFDKIEWVTRYVEKELELVHDRYITEVTEAFGAIKILGSGL